ncbi:hypothetical protein LZ009_12250 [Ramlibacter sp. XY19]|uniref:hypothetical protein n=1 Tax=Ramlibacter paludis TaxID=2908000 RepID=UPI0023DA8C48|nr:hypothetical protein [Ramlibacter paludis]MCG2593549.1 hypothetical protein [Ramlibacter paludis]
MDTKALDMQAVATREDVARQLGGLTQDEIADLLLRHLQRIAQLEHQLRVLQASQAQYIHSVHLERDGPAPWHEPHA